MTIITHVLWPAEIHGQTLAISPPPGQVVIVTNPRAYSLTKHPTLPVLYLTCSGAPESTNLITLRLNADGTLVRDSQRTWPDYLTTNPTNENFRYAIPRPIVLAEERILYLASCPVDPPRYCAETNNNEVAVIGLDGQGQPGKLLKAFRTTNTGQGITALGWDPTARRLFFSYHINGWFGWCQMDKAGLLVSNQTHFLPYPNSFWYFVYRPEWWRFYGYRGNSALGIMELTDDGLHEKFIQYAESGTGSMGNIEVSQRFLKLCMLEGPANKRIRVYQLSQHGRLTGVPRIFPLVGETKLVRYDFKAGILYAFSDNGALQTQPLDSAGYPTDRPQLFQLSCDGVRDAVVDEATGKVYVACTNATTVAK